jgi:hypothetical protein
LLAGLPAGTSRQLTHLQRPTIPGWPGQLWHHGRVGPLRRRAFSQVDFLLPKPDRPGSLPGHIPRGHLKARMIRGCPDPAFLKRIIAAGRL